MVCTSKGCISTNHHITNKRPPLALSRQFIHLAKLPAPRPNIHILQLHPLGLIPKLVHNHEQDEYRQQDVAFHKADSAERVQETRVPLEEDEEDVGCQCEVCAPWVEQGFVWQCCGVLALCDEGATEADVADADDGPDDEGRHWEELIGCKRGGEGSIDERTSGKGDQCFKDLSGTG